MQCKQNCFKSKTQYIHVCLNIKKHRPLNEYIILVWVSVSRVYQYFMASSRDFGFRYLKKKDR